MHEETIGNKNEGCKTVKDIGIRVEHATGAITLEGSACS